MNRLIDFYKWAMSKKSPIWVSYMVIMIIIAEIFVMAGLVAFIMITFPILSVVVISGGTFFAIIKAYSIYKKEKNK